MRNEWKHKKLQKYQQEGIERILAKEVKFGRSKVSNLDKFNKIRSLETKITMPKDVIKPIDI